MLLVESCKTDKLKYEEYDCDYSNCMSEEPTLGELDMKLTINSENLLVPLYIYRGNLEDNIILDTIFSDSENIKYEVGLNFLYTVVAEYIKNNDTILVVDGTNVEKISGYYCDSLCWNIKGGKLNLKLKY
jgi:hypothetical protein